VKTTTRTHLVTDGPDANDIVGVACEQGLTVGRPGERDTLNGNGLLSGRGQLGPELLDDHLALEVPDLDGGAGGGAQPVPDGREAEGVDGVLVRQGGQVTALVEVPQESGAVLAARGAQGTIGGDGDGVDETGVTQQVRAELAVIQVPDLDNLVPASRHNQRHLEVRGETHARHPLGMTVLSQGVLQVTKRVPQVDGLVARAGDDLTVVGGEGDAQHVLGVADETTGGVSGVEVPQTESTIPRTRQSELTIRGDGNILDKVRVTSQTLVCITVLLLRAG